MKISTIEHPAKEMKRNVDKRVRCALALIAMWQFAVFALLLLMIWANEIFALTDRVYDRPPSLPDYLSASLLSAFVLLACVLTIGQTYLKQKTMLTGMITVCSRCHKVRVEHDAWQAIEGYLSEYAPVEFSHGFCPDCYESEMAGIHEKNGRK